MAAFISVASQETAMKSPARSLFLLPTAVCVSTVALVAQPIELKIDAGPHNRVGTPMRWEIPSGVKLEGDVFRLLDPRTRNAVGAQRDGTALVWILGWPLNAGASATYLLVPGEAATSMSLKDSDRRHLLFSHAGRSILRYNYGVIEPPEGIEPLFARSGYIHPVWTPAGKVISNDFPPNHKHHHGIWFPWTSTTFEGRDVDFWNTGSLQGNVECTGVDARITGPVFGGFRARHRFLDLKAPGGAKEVLNEVWDVKTYVTGEGRYFMTDFLSVQNCSTDQPLKLNEYRYGGFGFRGSGQWEGQDVEFLTSEGKTRKDGHTTTARWCAVYGKVDGRPAGITFFCHPENFRAPQNMRIHPSEPFFNWAPCQAGDFEITPGKPYVSRYRFVTYDGAPDVEEMERLWMDYVEPPVVTVN